MRDLFAEAAGGSSTRSRTAPDAHSPMTETDASIPRLDGRTIVTGAAPVRAPRGAAARANGARVIATDLTDAARRKLEGPHRVSAMDVSTGTTGRPLRPPPPMITDPRTRQQRRCHAPARLGELTCRLGPRTRDQPHRRRCSASRRRAADGRRLVDRQRRLVGRAHRPLPGGVHREQVGAARAHARRGDRIRTTRHPGQHRAPGLHRDRHDGIGARRDARRPARPTPLERVGGADEVAAIVAFLLSDAAAYVSGAEIPVDGGFTSSGGAKFMADRIAGGSR